jgi:PAS domain S-box-containing protein
MEIGLAAAEGHWRRELEEQGMLLLAVLATLGLLLNFFVTRRIATLRSASHQLAKGDFGTRVSTPGSDEIAGLADDINSMAATLGQRERSLQDSEARYLALFENMQTGFALHQIITDASGKAVDYRFTLANPAFLNLMGMTKDELIGRLVSEIYPQIQDDPTDWIGIYGKVVSEGEPVRFKGYVMLLDRWVSVVAYRPEPGYFAVLVDDITESRRAEELEHYSAFQAGIAEMSTSVLHNIGNAITAVTQDAEVIDATGEALLRVAELLDHNATAGEQSTASESTSESTPQSTPQSTSESTRRQFAIQKEAARAIRRLSEEELSQRSRRLQVSVRHIADIIRIQQSAALPNNQTSSFSLTQAIESALEMQGDAFDKRDIQKTLAVDPAVDLVTLSHNRILQTLVNAVRNSIEAIDERTALAVSEGTAYKGHVHIRAEAVDRTWLRITVQDNGIGFDPATAASLFRFGFSTKARGSGFGLHSVAVFAQESGGSARLESDGIGQGARLIVELPFANGGKGGQQ